MPYIDCEIESWNFNVEFPTPDEDAEYSRGLVLHGETSVWGSYEKIPFEIGLYQHVESKSPYGVVLPLRQEEKSKNNPNVYIEIKTNSEAFDEVLKCLIESAKNEKLSTYLLVHVEGLELDIDYVWPEGKRLSVVGWSYHMKYLNE